MAIDLTLRSEKSSVLTTAEMDGNFQKIQDEINNLGATNSTVLVGGIQAGVLAARTNQIALSKVPRVIKQIKTMVTAPTITNTTTNPLNGLQHFAATNQADSPDGKFTSPAFSLFRGGRWSSGATYPNNHFVRSNDLTGSDVPTQISQCSFILQGSRFCVQMKGFSNVLIKIDDEFTSITPTVIPADGEFRYLFVDLSTSSSRRVDVIFQGGWFGGIWVDRTSVINPAPRRGLKTFVLSDSFGEGSVNEIGSIWSWVTYMSESLGWDDVTASAVGGTGLISTPAGQPAKVPFIQRIQHDVLDLMPNGETCILWISLSINDSDYTGAQISTALNALLDVVEASGKGPIIVISSPTISRGIGGIPKNQIDHNDAARAIANTRGCIFIDDIEMGVNPDFPVMTFTTTSAVAANATTVQTNPALVAGGTYKFNDGTRFFVFSTSGNTATVDRIATNQVVGANITLCGSCYLTGVGHAGNTTGFGVSDLAVNSDGTHPTNIGHRLKGLNCASLLIANLE